MRDADDVDRADLADLLLGQGVGDVAEVDDVDAVELDHEGDVPAALRPALVVAEGPHAGDEDVLDLVLARAVEDERLLQARRQVGRAVAGRPSLRPRQRGVVGVAERDDVAGDPASGRPDDCLVGIGDDDGVPPLEPHAGASVPRAVPCRDSATRRLHGEFAPRRAGLRRPGAPRRSFGPEKEDRRRLPIGASGRREGGRICGCRRDRLRPAGPRRRLGGAGSGTKRAGG